MSDLITSAGTEMQFIQYKTVAVSGMKVINDEEGIVEAFVSGIGNRDNHADIIEPGAFDNSIAKRLPKGVWAHDWSRPVSRTLEIKEIPAGSPQLPDKMKSSGIGGLYVKTQFNLNTEDGRYAYENVKFYGEESEWSIGYTVIDAEWDKKKKANILKELELYEYSPVLFGANPLTSTVSIKMLDKDGEAKAGVNLSSDLGGDTALMQMAEAIKSALEGKDNSYSLEIDMPEEVEDEVLEGGESKDAEGPLEVEADEQAPGGEAQVEAESDSTKEDDDSQQEPEGTIEEKVIAGSYEERRLALEEAIKEAFSEEFIYPWVYATFDTYVIVSAWDQETDNRLFFQVSYEDDGDGEFTFGELEEVEVVEVVLAKRAILDAVSKGHGEQLKSILAPLAEKAADSAPFLDVDIARAILGVKDAGAGLPGQARAQIKSAMKILDSLLEAVKGSDPVDEVESGEISVESTDVDTPEGGKEGDSEDDEDEAVNSEELAEGSPSGGGEKSTEVVDISEDLALLESLESLLNQE